MKFENWSIFDEVKAYERNVPIYLGHPVDVICSEISRVADIAILWLRWCDTKHCQFHFQY